MDYYVLSTKTGYVESFTPDGKLTITSKLKKEILNENKEFLELLSEVYNRNRQTVKVVKVRLEEVAG